MTDIHHQGRGPGEDAHHGDHALLGEIESARDSTGRALYPDAASTFAGLRTVSAPAATVPLVYDASRIYSIDWADFTADMSDTANGGCTTP